MNKSYTRINWQNAPSEATALNDVNLNKMDSAIDTIDDRVVAHDTRLDNDEYAISQAQGDITTLEGTVGTQGSAITALQNGKVDKSNGMGLSTLMNLEAQSRTNTGTIIGALLLDKYGQQATEIKLRNGIEVDSALSDSSENPVQNKVVKAAIDDIDEVVSDIEPKVQKTDMIQSNELFDITNIRENGLYNANNGQWNSNSSWWTSNPIPVSRGDTIYVEGDVITSSDKPSWVGFTSSDVFVLGTTATPVNNKFSFTINNANVDHVFIGFYKTTTPKSVSIHKTENIRYYIEEENVDGLVGDLSEINSAISEHTNKINAIDSDLTEYIEKSISDISFTNGAYIKVADGTTASNASFKYSEEIAVYEGQEITYNLKGYNNVIDVIAAYKADGTYVQSASVYYDSSYSSGVQVIFSGTYTVPAGVDKIRFCEWKNYADEEINYYQKQDRLDRMDDDIDEIKAELDTFDIVNNWKDKKWVAFGTSITDNYSENSYITQGEHAGEHTGKYVPYLLDLSELSQSAFVNRGISGGSINGHILYYIRYYTADEAAADLITIEGAVNDFASAVPLGNVGDTVPHTHSLLPDGTEDGTFAGACYQAFTTALTNAPNAVVVLLTETTGKNHVGYANYDQLRKNGLGLTQWDYIDMTIKVAKFVGIPIIMCGQDSMINAQNPQYIADHIHHTYLGGYQYAKVIWEKLKYIPLKALTLPE